MSRKRIHWVGWVFLLLLLFLSSVFVYRAISNTSLLAYGVRAQGTVINAESITCGKSSGLTLFVQFSDQTGREHVSSFNSCDYIGFTFNALSQRQIAIVYSPDDPSLIAPADGVYNNAFFYLLGTFVLLPLSLIAFVHRIRRHKQKPKDEVVK